MSDPRSHECPTPKKIAYKHSSAAHDAPGWRNAGMHPYQCRCGFWHLGHPFKTKNAIQRALRTGNTASRHARRVR